MPFYRFKCSACSFEKEKLMTLVKAKSHEEVCPECGSRVSLSIGKPNAIAKETSDEYRGKSIEMGISDKVLQRSKDHFQKHDLPRIIEEHGKEFVVRQGFVDPDKDPK
jgi:putative FmdB family regulatory protein